MELIYEEGKEVKDKILKVLELALEINPPEIENIGEKRTAVFVNWAPHVNQLSVRIYKDGWTENGEVDSYDAYTDGDDGRIDIIIAVLERIREEYK